jgi:hypothetical protein
MENIRQNVERLNYDKNMSTNDSSLKCERKWVDVSTSHIWLREKHPRLITELVIAEAETPKAVLLSDPVGIDKAWVAKSLIAVEAL